MADAPSKISIGELQLTFRYVEPTNELIESSADRLETYARAVARDVLEGHYEVVVVVSDGSLKEQVSLLVGIASLGVSLIGIDYSVARKNLDWLVEQSRTFTEAIANHETHHSQLPGAELDQDRSAIVRTRTTALDRLRALLRAAEDVHAEKGSKVRRTRLIEEVARVLAVCHSNEEKRELLHYLSADPNIEHALQLEWGRTYAEDLIRARPRAALQGKLPVGEPKPARRRKRRRAIRRFST